MRIPSPVHLLAVLLALLVAPAGASAHAVRVLHPETARAAALAHLPFVEAGTPSASISRAPRSVFPIVDSLSPRHVAIGQHLTIRGRNFRSGMHRNTVVFRAGGRFVFVKADRSTTRRIHLVIPAKLRRFLAEHNGTVVATRFSIRILAKRFGTSFTRPSRSPVVEPRVGGITPIQGCDRSHLAAAADADHDGMSNALELKVGTDPCLADTDGDGIPDGYEYESAIDYNSRALPYPGKRPYPNALDPTDVNIDHDGDGLTLLDEYQAWKTYGGSRFPLVFSSAGTQTSGGYQPAPTGALAYLDGNGDGQLTDDEKDYDGDGLPNWTERYGQMTPEWWAAKYDKETPYGLSRYAQTDWLNPDTDGDGLPDGADDVDHDGYSNLQEYDRERAGLWTNPFNPCLPQWRRPGPGVQGGSPTCSTHIPFHNAWEPWGQDGLVPLEPDYPGATTGHPYYAPYPWPAVTGWPYFD